jgi:hypothetical protein
VGVGWGWPDANKPPVLAPCACSACDPRMAAVRRAWRQAARVRHRGRPADPRVGGHARARGRGDSRLRVRVRTWGGVYPATWWLDAGTPDTGRIRVPGVLDSGESSTVRLRSPSDPLGSVCPAFRRAGSRSLFCRITRPALRPTLPGRFSAVASHLTAGPPVPNASASMSSDSVPSRERRRQSKAARLLTSDSRIHPARGGVKLFRFPVTLLLTVTYGTRRGVAEKRLSAVCGIAAWTLEMPVCNTFNSHRMPGCPPAGCRISTGIGRVIPKTGCGRYAAKPKAAGSQSPGASASAGAWPPTRNSWLPCLQDAAGEERPGSRVSHAHSHSHSV